jgi:RNA polymerase sigma factor (sigma-70 family)
MNASPLSALPDSTLAALVADGDRGAFDALYRRHLAALERYCLSILRHPQDAEEAAQAAMLNAYRSLCRGRAPAAVRAWMFRIARNECRDLIRGRTDEPQPLEGDVPNGAGGPHEGAELRERLRTLRRDIDDLPHEQRTALMLRSMAGMPHGEIARVVGGTAAGARGLVHEARRSLEEFEAGRELPCGEVRERIDTGDGRMLRARRVRAHLRTCDDCRQRAEVTGRRRRGLSILLPPLPVAAALRSLLGLGSGGSAGAPAAGRAGAGAAVVAAVVVTLGLAPGGGQAPAAPTPAGAPPAITAASPAAAPATTTPAGAVRGAEGTVSVTAPGRSPARPVADAAAGRQPAPAAAPAPAAPAPAAGSAPAAQAAAEPDRSSASAAPSAPAQAPPARTPAVEVPPISTPAIQTPSVTVPQVSVLPSVTVPAVTVPSVTVPPLVQGLPAIQTPQVGTPAVTTPPVATPEVTLPGVEVPAIRLPGVRLGGGG